MGTFSEVSILAVQAVDTLSTAWGDLWSPDRGRAKGGDHRSPLRLGCRGMAPHPSSASLGPHPALRATCPPCSSRKSRRACADPRDFRPLRKFRLRFLCHRQREAGIPRARGRLENGRPQGRSGAKGAPAGPGRFYRGNRKGMVFAAVSTRHCIRKEKEMSKYVHTANLLISFQMLTFFRAGG